MRNFQQEAKFIQHLSAECAAGSLYIDGLDEIFRELDPFGSL